MADEISTIQSLKAVDAWIDVINANINGGVRTAFKSSRLKFSGSNVDIQHAGNATSLPLQFPEPGLTTANTVIDFTQGAITASTENTHLAVQGDGFFLLVDPATIDTTPGATFGMTKANASAKFYLTRDGEFRTDQNGFLVNSNGYYLVCTHTRTIGSAEVISYGTAAGNFGAGSLIRAIYNDLDNPTLPTAGGFGTLTSYVQGPRAKDRTGALVGAILINVEGGRQSLQYTQFGSTVFDFGYKVEATPTIAQVTAGIDLTDINSGATVLTKSLEASNSSMTQSVPELSLAQKLFSALTKVLQTKQTNVDGVLNLVR